jgi:hypothetical protein
MSRRIIQTLQRTLRTSQFQSIQTTVTRRLPVKARHTPTSILPVRRYATESPRGVPVNEEAFDEHVLTPAEKERASLQKQALYTLSLCMYILTSAEKKSKPIIPTKQYRSTLLSSPAKTSHVAKNA